MKVKTEDSPSARHPEGTLFEELRLMRQGAERPSIADEVRYYLEIRYSERIRLKDLAHRLGVHPNYMTRVFREKFGVAPKQYLTDLKLTKACRLLESTDYTIAFIADTLGFDDQMAFSKTFRGKYGMAPSEYRRKAETGA